MSKRVILAGGSGFLGESLTNFLLGRGYEVTVLSRGKEGFKDGAEFIRWDGKNMDARWVDRIDGSCAVVNFTGKSVNCIYTEKNKREIIESRLDSVRVLKEAVLNAEQPPPVFVQAGSLAIFGDTEEVCDEESPLADGFSPEVCKLWEGEFFSGDRLPHTRQVLLRIGFALGRGGGALEPLVKLARMGLGGTIGSGRQYISWLHIDDLNSMFLNAIEDPEYSGVYNATGPHPVRNKEFMQTLRKVLNKGWSPPAPSPFVKAGAYLFMRAEPELALTGRNCVPKRLQDNGFAFQYTDLEKALRDLV